MEKKINDDLTEKIKESLTFSSKKVCYRWLRGNMNIIQNMPAKLKM